LIRKSLHRRQVIPRWEIFTHERPLQVPESANFLPTFAMSTIERERRVEFNDGMDELPSLVNDVENLCDALEGADPRTAAILRRRYEKRGLMKAYPTDRIMTPPSALGLPPLDAKPCSPEHQKRMVVPPRPRPLPLETKTTERPSVEKTERKSWADMSTESEDENGDVVESFGSAASAEGAVEGQEAIVLAWDPINNEASPKAGSTPTSEKGAFWLKVWQNMTGTTMDEHLAKQGTTTPPEAATSESRSELEGSNGGVAPSTGYVPCQAQAPVMNTQQLPVLQAVQAVPVQPVPVQPMMMMFFTPKPMQPNGGPGGPGQPGQPQQMNFMTEAQSFHSVHSVQSEPEIPPMTPLPTAPCFHMKTAQLGQLSADRRSFTKTKSKGRLSIASTDRLYNCGIARYSVQFTSGELSNADGVGIVFSSQLPCPQNIQRIISIFANRTGRICMRADADVERSHVNIKAMELGDWLEVVCDFDSRKVTFSVWPADGGNVSSATVDFSGASDRFRRLSAQVPSCAAGYLAVVLKHPGLTVTLGDA